MENTVSDFTGGKITGKLIKFMIPILGSLILQAAYGAVDVLMVGWFGTTEGLSGVSIGSSIINLVTFVLTAPTGKPVGFWWIGLHHVRTPFSGFGTRAAAQSN